MRLISMVVMGWGLGGEGGGGDGGDVIVIMRRSGL